MGLDIRVNIERIEDGRWVNPVELMSMFPDERHVPAVKVCWFSAKGSQKDLLFGPHAVVPMRRGLPGDRCAELHFPRSGSEPWVHYEGWCPLEDLWLDSWETESVLISANVEAGLAEAFGNGVMLN